MKIFLKIYGGFCIALFVLSFLITLGLGFGMVASTGETVTAEGVSAAITTAFSLSVLAVMGYVFVFIGLTIFCVFAVFLPLYILDVKGVDTRVYNIVLMCLFVVAVIVLAAVGAKLGSAVLVLLAVPAVPMLIYNAFSLPNGIKIAKKKAMLKLNQGQIVEESVPDIKNEEVDLSIK